jgi:hypothetical protein
VAANRLGVDFRVHPVIGDLERELASGSWTVGRPRRAQARIGAWLLLVLGLELVSLPTLWSMMR